MLSRTQVEINIIIAVAIVATLLAYLCFQSRRTWIDYVDRCMTFTKDAIHPKRTTTVTVTKRSKNKYVRIQEKDENDEVQVYTPAEAQKLIADTMFPASPIPIPPKNNKELEEHRNGVQFYPYHLLPSEKSKVNCARNTYQNGGSKGTKSCYCCHDEFDETSAILNV